MKTKETQAAAKFDYDRIDALAHLYEADKKALCGETTSAIDDLGAAHLCIDAAALFLRRSGQRQNGLPIDPPPARILVLRCDQPALIPQAA